MNVCLSNKFFVKATVAILIVFVQAFSCYGLVLADVRDKYQKVYYECANQMKILNSIESKNSFLKKQIAKYLSSGEMAFCQFLTREEKVSKLVQHFKSALGDIEKIEISNREDFIQLSGKCDFEHFMQFLRDLNKDLFYVDSFLLEKISQEEKLMINLSVRV